VNYCAEAARIVTEELATPAQVDAIVNDAIGGGGPFLVMDLTKGNALSNKCLALMQEAHDGNEWFAPLPILEEKASSFWHNRDDPGDSTYGEDLKDKVLRRILAVLFARTFYVLDNDICEATDLNWLTKNALGFRKGLLDLAEEFGINWIREICMEYAESNQGFEIPPSIESLVPPVFNRHVIIKIREDGVAVIEIFRPEVKNALNNQVIAEILTALDELNDDQSVGGVVITSYDGSIAGADIGGLAALKTSGEASAQCERWHEVHNFLITMMDKPVVAALDGPVMGGGAELAMGCDARVVGPNLILAQPEVNLGFIPGFGGTQFLPRIVGVENAAKMLRTGKPIKAQEAFELGWASVAPVKDGNIVQMAAQILVGGTSDVVDLEPGTVELEPMNPDPIEVPDKLPAVNIGHCSTAIDEILVDLLLRSLSMNLFDGLKEEAKAFGHCMHKKDFRIGLGNFMKNGPRVPAEFTNS
jgi:enoyl-CoA hydratase/carnithine racemase